MLHLPSSLFLLLHTDRKNKNMYVHSLTSYLWRCISDKHLLFTPNKNEVMVSFILQNSVKEISFMCGKWMLFGLLIFSTNLTVHQSLFMQWSGCICLVLKSSCGINLRKFRMKRIKRRKKNRMCIIATWIANKKINSWPNGNLVHRFQRHTFFNAFFWRLQ